MGQACLRCQTCTLERGAPRARLSVCAGTNQPSPHDTIRPHGGSPTALLARRRLDSCVDEPATCNSGRVPAPTAEAHLCVDHPQSCGAQVWHLACSTSLSHGALLVGSAAHVSTLAALSEGCASHRGYRTLSGTSTHLVLAHSAPFQAPHGYMRGQHH